MRLYSYEERIIAKMIPRFLLNGKTQDMASHTEQKHGKKDSRYRFFMQVETLKLVSRSNLRCVSGSSCFQKELEEYKKKGPVILPSIKNLSYFFNLIT